VPKIGNKDLWVQSCIDLGVDQNIWTKRHVPFFHLLFKQMMKKGRRSCYAFYGFGMNKPL
jgi:hypothetical protein